MSEPPEPPKPRKSIRSEDIEKFDSFKNNLRKSHVKDTSVQQNKPNKTDKLNELSENEESFNDDSSEYEEQIIDQSETKKQFHHSQNRSRTLSPEKIKVSLKKVLKCSPTRGQSPKIKQDTKSWKLSNNCYLIILFILAMIVFPITSNFEILPNMYKTQQPKNNHHNLLFKFIEDVKVKFHNQESDSWNDISSAINEVISRTPKVPSIILLFANETSTMDCLATELAHLSSIMLHTDHPESFNPEDFGNNAGDIINRLKENFPSVKVIVIRDILNINAEAIKALHFLCDRVSPLIDEAIYILTMQTNTYQPSKKRLSFVEENIRHKLSKSIDQDILMPLITRITDGAIILVQPESNLEHCLN